MNTPNLFIVGAMRAYTTTMFDLLSRSPAVSTCKTKEPNHFCTDLYRHPEFPLTQTKWRHVNEAWVDSRDEYLSLFPDGRPGVSWICEASPRYLFSLDAAKNISEFNPNARIICLLRNPIDRAYSEYIMNMVIGIVGRGGRENDAFLSAVHQDYIRYRSNNLRLVERYIDAGMYSVQIQRYLKHFPRENIHIEVVDSPGNSPASVMRSIFRFLGLSTQTTEPPRLSIYHPPRWPGLNSLLLNSGLKALFSTGVSDDAKALFKAFYYRNSRVDKIRPGARAYLKWVYRDETARLQELLSRDLSFWFDRPTTNAGMAAKDS